MPRDEDVVGVAAAVGAVGVGMAARAAERTIWVPAYIGLGSNVGDSRAAIGRALEVIGSWADTRLVIRSSCYRTTPFGPVERDPFINAAAGVLTHLAPGELLTRLRTLERQLGRAEKRVRWGPREIDLDLLVHGEWTVTSDELVLPHPGIPERDFVLYPLRDIAPHLRIPGMGVVHELASNVADRGIERLD